MGLGAGHRSGHGDVVAHLYAEVVGDRVRHGSRLDVHEVTSAMANSLPILLVAVLPAVMLLLGRVEVLDERRRAVGCRCGRLRAARRRRCLRRRFRVP